MNTTDRALVLMLITGLCVGFAVGFPSGIAVDHINWRYVWKRLTRRAK